MGADISRVRFDPLHDFAGVVLQQGRLLLDADFNELVALLDRRLRAETCDLTSFGPDPDHAGVAWVPRQTPDAFRVDRSPAATSRSAAAGCTSTACSPRTTGSSRDGLRPAALGGHRAPRDTPYVEQPYWPTPDALPTGRRRTSRTSTCGSARSPTSRIPTWSRSPSASTRRRAGRRRGRCGCCEVPTGTTCADRRRRHPGLARPDPPVGRPAHDGHRRGRRRDDPCELPPIGGYRGLENQTYRVEIHDGGDPRRHRDLQVVARQRLGRDARSSRWSRRRFCGSRPSAGTTCCAISTGDWVEIIDDNVRARPASPGEIRKVTVDDAERTITFTGALPADLQPADADGRGGAPPARAALGPVGRRPRRRRRAGHRPRRRGLDRRDHGAGVSARRRSCSSTASSSRSRSPQAAAARSGAGDHWIFAARTADASIEQLDAAPPHGVHHHYARLGIVTFPDSADETAAACGRRSPDGGGESCDCTVCVTPESHASGALTIQDADRPGQGAGGGTVCLAAGVYDIGRRRRTSTAPARCASAARGRRRSSSRAATALDDHAARSR